MAVLNFNPALQKQMDKAEYTEVVASIIHSYDDDKILEITGELALYIAEYVHGMDLEGEDQIQINFKIKE